MKDRTASLLQSVGRVINMVTLLAAFIYVISVVMWIHAPVLDALWVAFTMALIPLVLAWLCKSLGRHLQRKHAGPPSSPLRQRVLAAVGIVTVLGCAYVGYRVVDMVQCSEDHARNAAAREALSQKKWLPHDVQGRSVPLRYLAALAREGDPEAGFHTA